MFQSLRYSNVFLRLGLAAVFIWFGVDKFISPQYWLDTFTSQNELAIVSKLSISSMDFVYAVGVFELLVGASILTNIFIKIFSILAVFYFIFILISSGVDEVSIRDVGLMGGLLTLFFWPERRLTL